MPMQVLVTFSMVETCNEDFMKFTFGNSKVDGLLPVLVISSKLPNLFSIFILIFWSFFVLFGGIEKELDYFVLMLASVFLVIFVQIMVLPTNIARSRTSDTLEAGSISCALSTDLKELVKLTEAKKSPMDV
ncbi:hypothetical protein RHSIM_Rhsim06G0024800 [Rhododendron simsii]|uniref:Uncharacterized protein n=1 Tax=Rhododendron simsii TaxID=118357 RepID=A0A834GS40_RHOSS|nr:hypothetical protein RHSIM_Rhsim06G0024800 [Rhododendron simsii]